MSGLVGIMLVLVLFSVFLAGGVHVTRGSAPGQTPQGEFALDAKAVKKAARDHVDEKYRENGGFYVIKDARIQREWRLKPAGIRDVVHRFEKGNQTVYVACADFKTEDGLNTLDIDLWLANEGGHLKVIETRIHSVNRQPRFSYEGTVLRAVP